MSKGLIKFLAFLAFLASGLMCISAGHMILGLALIGMAILIPAS